MVFTLSRRLAAEAASMADLISGVHM